MILISIESLVIKQNLKTNLRILFIHFFLLLSQRQHLRLLLYLHNYYYKLNISKTY